MQGALSPRLGMPVHEQKVRELQVPVARDLLETPLWICAETVITISIQRGLMHPDAKRVFRCRLWVWQLCVIAPPKVPMAHVVVRGTSGKGAQPAVPHPNFRRRRRYFGLVTDMGDNKSASTYEHNTHTITPARLNSCACRC